MSGPPWLATVGVIGHTRATFEAALRGAAVDLVVDVRRRRAVRGAEYAWANARRLEAALDELGVAYRHWPAAAPSAGLVQLQGAADAAAGIPTRARRSLAPAFVAGYRAEVLDRLDPAEAAAVLAGAERPALLCIEREPTACHRALLAAALGAAEVDHLR